MAHKKGSSGEEISDFVEYSGGEFCSSVQCEVWAERSRYAKGSDAYSQAKTICEKDCRQSMFTFIRWLHEQGYVVEGGTGDKSCPAHTAYEYHDWIDHTGQRIVRRS